VLVELCARVNKEMRAAEKKEKKEGGTSRPKSTRDAVMVLVKEQRKMNSLLTSFLDSYRAVVSFSFPASHRRFARFG
jgi:hypothetical protein